MIQSAGRNVPSCETRYVALGVTAVILVILSAITGATILDYVLDQSTVSKIQSVPTEQVVPRPANAKESKRNSNSSSNDQFTIIIPMNERVASCLEDVTDCPTYPDGQFELDWSTRYQKKNRAGCYFEFKNVNPSCPQACDEIFQEGSHSPELGLAVTIACKIGCSYAIQAKQDNKEICHLSCKNTIWDHNENDRRCGRQNGLGINPPLEIPFNVGKACEFGCVLGNERPCPMCDLRAAHVGVTV